VSRKNGPGYEEEERVITFVAEEDAKIPRRSSITTKRQERHGRGRISP